MKAITLYQPWATLVALGKKKIETRSWKTDYRGPLAIHVAKKFTGEQRYLCCGGSSLYEPFTSALKGVFWNSETINKKYGFAGGIIYDGPATRYFEIKDNYHLGCVIAVCQLVAIVEIPPKDTVGMLHLRTKITFPSKKYQHKKIESDVAYIPPAEPELSFGDYTPGRYAWILRDVRMLEKPVPAKGMQRLWEWEDGKL